MKQEEIKGFLKQMGVSDEEIETTMKSPIADLFASFEKFYGRELVAEVATSKNCSAGLQVGQKLVFNLCPATLKPEKSTAPLCLRATPGIASATSGIWTALMNGCDPNRALGCQTASCMDPGIGKGGFGSVTFKVYVI